MRAVIVILGFRSGKPLNNRHFQSRNEKIRIRPSEPETAPNGDSQPVLGQKTVEIAVFARKQLYITPWQAGRPASQIAKYFRTGCKTPIIQRVAEPKCNRGNFPGFAISGKVPARPSRRPPSAVPGRVPGLFRPGGGVRRRRVAR